MGYDFYHCNKRQSQTPWLRFTGQDATSLRTTVATINNYKA